MKRIAILIIITLMLSFSGCKNNPTTPKTNNPPVINILSISPTTINKGESATLSWNVTNSTSVSIDQGVGSVAASGSRSMNPDNDTVYTLTASNNDGTVTKSCEIKVLQPPITTVYITATGTKYHLDGCQYLSDSKIAISLVDACKKGYGPCSVCKPPPCPESFHYEDK